MTTTPSVPAITVLLADRSDVSRFGLRGLLQADRRFAVIGDVPIDVVGAAERLQPDLIAFDPASGVALDLRIIDELHRVAPNARLVVVTMVFEPRSFMAAMLHRVHGYLLKDSGGQAALLVETLALVAQFGVVVVDAPIAEHFWSLPDTPIQIHVPGPAILTTREVEVLTPAIQGLSDQEIGDRLYLSRNTVDYHILHVEHKLGAANRLQLGCLLHERGLL